MLAEERQKPRLNKGRKREKNKGVIAEPRGRSGSNQPRQLDHPTRAGKRARLSREKKKSNSGNLWCQGSTEAKGEGLEVPNSTPQIIQEKRPRQRMS